MATTVVKMYLEIGLLNMDRGAKLTMVKAHINIQVCGMGRESYPFEMYGIATVQPLKEGGGRV